MGKSSIKSQLVFLKNDIGIFSLYYNGADCHIINSPQCSTITIPCYTFNGPTSLINGNCRKLLVPFQKGFGQMSVSSLGNIDIIVSHTHPWVRALAYFDFKKVYVHT